MRATIIGLILCFLTGCVSRLSGGSNKDTNPTVGHQNVASTLHAEPLLSVDGDNDTVGSLVFSPNGKMLAYADRSDSVRVWQIPSGKKLDLATVYEACNPVAFSADSKLLVTGYRANYACAVWDTASGHRLRTLQHSGKILAANWSPKGHTLATTNLRVGFLSNVSGELNLWDADTGTLLHRLSFSNPIFTCAFSPDGRSVAVGSGNHFWQFGIQVDGRLNLVDVATGKVKRSIDAHRGWVTCAAFSPDGWQIATGGSYKMAKLWDVATGKVLFKLSGHIDGLNSVAFSPDGRWLLTADSFGVKLWSTSTGLEQHGFLPSPKASQAATFSPDGRLIATGGTGDKVHVWRVESR